MALHSADETRVASLMRAAISGDEAAYAEFLRVAAVMIRGLACRKLQANGVIAPEDIVQETLLAVHIKRHTWRQDQPILPWLFTITRYKIVDAYRRKGIRSHLDLDDVADHLPAAEPNELPATEQQLQNALSILSDGQRRVVQSIAMEGRSITETAAAFGMKETAVRVAFHRGLAAIAARFGRLT